MNSPPELSNNPFLADASSPHNRFPDLNATQNPPTGYTGYSSSPNLGAQYAGGGYAQFSTGGGGGYQSQFQQPLGQQQPYQQQQSYQSAFGQQQQQQQAYGGWSGGTPSDQFNGGYPTSPTAGINPLSAQMTGMPGFQGQGGAGYGGMQQLQQPQQQPMYGQQQMGYGSGYPASPGMQMQMGTGYYGGFGGQTQQPIQQQQAYLSEFDPYGGASQTTPSHSRSASTTSISTTTSSSAPSSNGRPHPREYIRSHKLELERWDSYAWKQVLNAFDDLRVAWEKRKDEVVAHVRRSGFYLGVQEGERLRAIQKEAETNIDTIAAAGIQMQEVFSGYRQSGDLASKSRVRESVNAALQVLPDWPQS